MLQNILKIAKSKSVSRASKIIQRLNLSELKANQEIFYRDLGERAYFVLSEGSPENLKEDERFITLLGKISENKKAMEALKSKMFNSKKEC